MKPMDAVRENVAIDLWAKAFSRSAAQVNAPHETDAEIVTLLGDDTLCLAATVDTVAEELASGLYRDPFTAGWVAVMASLSDLAAVGADPLGVLVAVSLPGGMGRPSLMALRNGVESACRHLDTHVLGGDLNEASSVSLTSCALGLVPRQGLLTRLGARPGDAVYITGRAGMGNALGLARAAGVEDGRFPEERYRPTARVAAGRALRGVASCAMDTSDGVLATLDQLSRLGGVGFDVDVAAEEAVHPEVLALCRSLETPAWMMLAGPHGEFELIFTVQGSDENDAVEGVAAAGLEPVRLGRVRAERGVSLVTGAGERAELDVASIRNLPATGRALSEYAAELRELGRSWGLE
jgi:thiamine-monophosphate kinase